jgi:glycosyltransferase involved in cell wall biosynthesis
MKAACSMHADTAGVHSACLVVPGSLETKTGGYIYDRRIFEELANSGWHTTTVSLNPSFPSPTRDALDHAKASFDRLPDGQIVVIDGLALAGLTALLPAIVARLSPVALIHHPLADETGIESKRAVRLEAAEKAALAMVPQIIVTSPWTRRRLSDYGVEPTRIAVVQPGIDRGPDVAREPSTTVRLLSVASVTPRKGHAILVEALARLKDLDWSLRCAGSLVLDVACAEALTTQLEQTGLNRRVALLGELSPDRVRDEYARADLFVLPSYLEGYGMALAEAIAHGLPVVSTTSGAIPDTVPERASRLVPPGDVDALTAVLGGLIRDPVARGRLVRGAGASAGSISTWRQAAQDFASVLIQSASE